MTNTSANNTILDRRFLAGIPKAPGVYLMKDAAGTVLYVGKARDLRNRLASYARYRGEGRAKTAMLLDKVRAVETILTGTEKEALLLESALIKKHRPRYNVILRDDKSYPLIKVTVNETWPRVVMTRRRLKDGARYFGPFASSSAMWETLNYLNSLFPLRRCRGKEVKKRSRPCLNFQMGRCLAPCVGKTDRERYLEMVRHVLMILEGRKDRLIAELEKRMEEASQALRFEEAALCRDWLRAITRTLEKQVMVAPHFRDQDVFALERQGETIVVAAVLVRQGAVEDCQTFCIEETVESDAGVVAAVLKQFYGEERHIPAEILVPTAPDDMELMVEWLSEQRGAQVRIAVPRRGDRRRLLAMAAANASQALADRRQRHDDWQRLAVAAAQTLRLSRRPEHIECLDISNIGGEQAVGALVCFRQGRKESAGYRHYKIRSVSGPDDYAMMDEVLRRRLAKGMEQGDLPDLLVVDGGRGQLQVAARVVAELGLEGRVELAGIAKERAGEGEKLYRPGRKNPLRLARHAPVLLLFMRIRDEAHRYGISFHRRWRRRHALASDLDSIPGVGKGRRQQLLAHLGSFKRVSQASESELAAVPGIGPRLAAQIWRYFHADANV